MTDSVDGRKWWSKALFVGAIVGAVALPVGALGTKLGIWPFTVGFMLLAVGVVLATIVFFLGIIAAVYTSMKKLHDDRRSSLIGVAISVVILGLMGNQFITASSVPSIHNISTDTLNPPQFEHLVAVREAEGANPLAYDASELAGPQQENYPYVKSLITTATPAQVFQKASQALEGLGMEIAYADASRGHIEATDTTFWFGFKDDVVVRVVGEGAGSIVDIRSVSRVGQSDLGKNAQRIGQILHALNAE